MRKYILQLLSVTTLLGAQQAFAGNPDRAGGAGATQLLINPYAKSAGLMGANTAGIRGVESFQYNIAGLAYVNKTDIAYSNTIYLQGTDVYINNLSFAQSLGSGNVLGISFNSFSYGNIPITTESQPDGTLGTYSPQFLNFGLAYAKKFSNSITGGVDVRVISEGANNVRATGVGLSAGVQYQTALGGSKKDSISVHKRKIKKEDFRFGISIKNLGPNMQYSGSGLSFRSINPVTGADRRSYMGSESFNLPALVHIGVAYDMRLDEIESDTYFHRLTASGNFNYNSFSENITSVGLEYAFKELVMFRAGYAYQENITSADEYRTQYIGFAGGLGFVLPVSKSGTRLAIDYSYAPTRVFNGVHNITLALLIGDRK
jgi:hypothetical protein